MKLTSTWILTLAMVSSAIMAYGAEKTDKKKAPAKAEEVVESKILKVYSAKYKNDRYVAYLVKWKDYEIVIKNESLKTIQKEGDTLKFIVKQSGIAIAKLKVLEFQILGDTSFSFFDDSASKEMASAKEIEAPTNLEIIKVFSAKENGFKYFSYLVKWKDQEVVVEDVFGMGDKEEGDIIRVAPFTLKSIKFLYHFDKPIQ